MLGLRVARVAAMALLCACRFPDLPPIPDDDAAVSFTIAPPARSWVRIDGTADLTLEIDRGGGYRGEVTVRLDSPPPGISAATVMIPAEATSTTMTIAASRAAGASPGDERTLSIVASGPTEVQTSAAILVAGEIGSIDTTYGIQGFVAAGDSIRESTVYLEDLGQVLVATDGVIRRLNATGDADRAFGIDGRLTPDYGFDPALPVLVGLLPVSGDRFYAIANGDTDLSSGNRTEIRVARYAYSGVADPSWSGRTYSLPESLSLYTVAPAPTGLGSLFIAGGIADVEGFILKIDAQGFPDRTFGVQGYVRVAGAPIVTIAPTSDGGVFAVTATDGMSDLVLFDSAGRPVSAFGDAGRVQLNAAPTPTTCSTGFDLRIDGDGRIVVAGAVCTSPGPPAGAIWRFDGSGRRDSSFDGDGLWRYDSSNYELITLTSTRPDGSMYAVGATLNNDRIGTLFHLAADGAPGPDLAPSGRRSLGIRFTASRQAFGLERRWYLAGQSDLGTSSIVRLWY